MGKKTFDFSRKNSRTGSALAQDISALSRSHLPCPGEAQRAKTDAKAE